MKELVYSMDILAPKHKVTLDFHGKFSPAVIRNMPSIISSTLSIPLHRVYELTLQWDTSPGERVKIYCKWMALETEVDPYSTLKIIVEMKGVYTPKEGTAEITLVIKGFIDTKIKYLTLIDKKIKEKYVDYIYQKRRGRLREIGKLYLEKLIGEFKNMFGIEVVK